METPSAVLIQSQGLFYVCVAGGIENGLEDLSHKLADLFLDIVRVLTVDSNIYII